MKKFKLFLGLTIAMTAGCIIFGDSALAAEQPENKAYLINESTGEVEELQVREVTTNLPSSRSVMTDSGGSETSTFEIFAPIEVPEDSKLSRTSSGSNKTSGGVTAKINVNYDINSKGDQIRVNSYNGSWTPSSGMYVISGRAAGVHSGFVAGGKSMTKYPTGNSFNYKTGWGYNTRLLGGNSPRTWVDCVIKVSGMSGQHKLVLEHTF